MPTAHRCSSRRFISTSSAGAGAGLARDLAPGRAPRSRGGALGGDEDLVEADAALQTALPQRSPSDQDTPRRCAAASRGRPAARKRRKLRGAAVVGPRRHHVVELGAAGVVRDRTSPGHVHACAARASSSRRSAAVDLRPVLPRPGRPSRARPGPPTPPSSRCRIASLMESSSIEDSPRDVGEAVPAAPRRWPAPARVRLGGVGIGAGRVHEPGGEAEGAGVHRFAIESRCMAVRHVVGGGRARPNSERRDGARWPTKCATFNDGRIARSARRGTARTSPSGSSGADEQPRN